MSGDSREGIVGHVDGITSGAVAEGGCLAVRIARNIPYLEAAIGRSRQDGTFVTKQTDAGDFVGVANELVNLGKV